jgi:hypothetical protein
MARSSPRVHQLLKSGEYPIFTKIVMESRQSHLSRDDQFRYGLERVLDCIVAALPSTVEPPVAAHREGQEDRDDQHQPGDGAGGSACCAAQDSPAGPGLPNRSASTADHPLHRNTI